MWTFKKKHCSLSPQISVSFCDRPKKVQSMHHSGCMMLTMYDAYYFQNAKAGLKILFVLHNRTERSFSVKFKDLGW